MKDFKKILLPVDLSEVSPKLLPYVKTMAERFGAEVHVLFVARMFGHLSGMYVPDPSIAVFEEEVVKGADRKMQEFMDQYLKDLPGRSDVVTGDPAEQILKYTENQGIDLIIMSTHGRKGLERVIFGSVAEYVVKNSTVPVLTINPHRVAD